MNRALIAAVSLLMSCVHNERLTVDEHETEAGRHEKAARDERTQAEQSRLVPAARELGGVDYDPRAAHLSAADSEMRRAAEHLAAAKDLERFEDQACAQIPPAERAACPLLASQVERVRETPTGIELVLKAHVDGRDTHRRLDCHLAFARASGFAKPSCPLFVQGMSIRLQGEKVIEMSGKGVVARELQRQARRIFGVDPAPAVSTAP